MKTKHTSSRTRTGTAIESQSFINEVAPQFRHDITRKDGDANAARVYLWADTGKPVYNQHDSYARTVYPWLLADIFSIKPARK